MALDMILMIKKTFIKKYYFFLIDFFGEKYFRTENIFFRKPKNSKMFIENEYKHFRKSRKNLEKIEIFFDFFEKVYIDFR